MLFYVIPFKYTFPYLRKFWYIKTLSDGGIATVIKLVSMLAVRALACNWREMVVYAM